MRVLIIHNRYRESGGEDIVVDQESRLLRSHGHEVFSFELTNDEDSSSVLHRLAVPVEMIWSLRAARDIRQLIERFEPDIAHIHNTHFRISLAAVSTCDDLGVPVVMTLHNYRLICPAATLFRDGTVCEDCIGKAFAYPGVMHACWRGSVFGTAMVAAASAIHRAARSLDRVALFLAPSEFTRGMYVRAGLDPRRIVTHPNHLAADPGTAPFEGAAGFVSVGRLSPEKGTDVLLRAWEDLPDVPLRIVGDGPLRTLVESFARDSATSNVKWIGPVDHSTALEEIRTSTGLVYPSTCYETFGMALLEASALGRPSIVSDVGAPAELIKNGFDGIAFRSGDPSDLARAVRDLWTDRDRARAMGGNARSRYEERFGDDRPYRSLVAAYESVLERKR